MQKQQYGSTICFITSGLMLLLALSRASWGVFRLLPKPVKSAMPIGLGLLLALTGFQEMQLVVNDKETGQMAMGPIGFSVVVGLLGLCLATVLHHHGWGNSYILLPMVLTTAVGWISATAGWIEEKEAPLPAFGDWTDVFEFKSYLDFGVILNAHWTAGTVLSGLVSPCVSLYIICLFDIGCITHAVADVADLIRHKGTREETIHGAHGVFIGCAIGSAIGGMMGVSPMIALGESFAGVFAGGRTGITAIVTGVCFLVAIPFATFFTAVPLFASSPVLVLIGVDLLKLIRYVNLDGTYDAVVAFFVIGLMPYLYSIDQAIMFGLVMHVLLRSLDLVFCCSWRQSQAQDQDQPPALGAIGESQAQDQDRPPQLGAGAATPMHDIRSWPRAGVGTATTAGHDIRSWPQYGHDSAAPSHTPRRLVSAPLTSPPSYGKGHEAYYIHGPRSVMLDSY
jgi:AGZA family xanthine/uracil permease-like MFS transporter